MPTKSQPGTNAQCETANCLYAPDSELPPHASYASTLGENLLSHGIIQIQFLTFFFQMIVQEIIQVMSGHNYLLHTSFIFLVPRSDHHLGKELIQKSP